MFLRGVLERFLPTKLRCGTGFIASSESVSRQQDIIIYDPAILPVLLEIGDCLVVDEKAVAGTIEVKTCLSSRAELAEVFDKILALRAAFHGFTALYAWEGLSLEIVLEHIWERSRALPTLGDTYMPDVVYVRGQYILVPNDDGRRESPPVLLLRLGPKHYSEGAGLLSLIEQLWISGVQRHAIRPWWVDAWRGTSAARYKQVPWPSDLLNRAEAEVAALTANH